MRLSLRSRGLQSLDASALVISEENNEIESFKKPSHMDVIAMDASHNRLHFITGARSLRFLRDLDLSFNQLTTLIGLPPSLERLSVTHNVLRSLDGVDTLICLKHLDASNNKIVDISTSQLSSTLASLYLSSNLLKSCKGLLHCQQLLTIHIDNNNISRIEDVALLGGLRSLRHLAVAGNPVARNPSMVTALERAIPKLTTLDKVPLSQAAYRQHLACARRSSSRSRSGSAPGNASAADYSSRRFEVHPAASSGGRGMALEPEEEEDIEELAKLDALEARAKELTSLLKSESAREAELKKMNAQLKSQLHRTYALVDEQQYELDKLRRENDGLSVEAAPLQRAYAALGNAFKHQHASVVFSRIGAELSEETGRR